MRNMVDIITERFQGDRRVRKPDLLAKVKLTEQETKNLNADFQSKGVNNNQQPNKTKKL